MNTSRPGLTPIVATLLLLSFHVSGQGAVQIDFVTVGNPGNAGELSGEGAGGFGPDRICGAVDYIFQIGKYEVTNSQYCAFLNAVAASDPHDLYDPNMADPDEGGGIFRSGFEGSYIYSVRSGYGNIPVNWVTFWDACRFVNWLHNGQGSGDTETGAYTLTSEGMVNNTIVRNAGWRYAVSSEDEWYKAAYHKNDGVTGGYWNYPTGTDTPPTGEVPPGTDFVNGSASYGADIGLVPYGLIQVGSYTALPSTSPYGTFDQGGNAHEYHDTIINVAGHATISDGSYRGMRGGSFSGDNNHLDLHAAWRDLTSPGVSDDGESGDNDITFRVARFAVPVYRFWSPVNSRHFYTISETERQKLINTYSHVWTYEGLAYSAHATASATGPVPVYRFWSEVLGGHFYTIKTTERDKLINNYSDVWTYEGPAFYAYPEGSEPGDASAVYRFWSESLGGHFYTIDEAESNKLITTYSHVWTYEGIAWYAYE